MHSGTTQDPVGAASYDSRVIWHLSDTKGVNINAQWIGEKAKSVSNSILTSLI